MSKLFLKDLLSDVISGEWGNEPNGASYIKVIRTTNFLNDGRLNLEKEVVLRDIDPRKIEKKRLNYGDIIIEKSGGSPTQPVGRVVYFDLNEDNFLCNNFTAILRPKPDVNSKFLFYAFYYLHSQGRTLSYQNKTTGIINLKLDNYLGGENITLPSTSVQKNIASVLMEAESLIQKRKQAIAKMDELVDSVFIEMFGDLSINKKGWKLTELHNVAEIASGVTKGKKYREMEMVSVPYMRVANVQDGFLDLSVIKEVVVSHNDVNRYRLDNRDVLLTEGGDPDKLGRGAVWNAEIDNCIHQNHIFRVRVNNQILNPYFLTACTGSRYGKRYFLKMAKQTTGIATVNMTQLKGFPVLLPPIELQNQYEQFLQEINSQTQQMQNQLRKLKENFQSLLQRAFSEQLDLK